VRRQHGAPEGGGAVTETIEAFSGYYLKTSEEFPEGKKYARVSETVKPGGLPDLPHIVEAAEIGTIAHSFFASFCSDSFKPDTVPEAYAPRVALTITAWKQWKEEVGDFWPISVERRILSDKLRVGGTMDLCADFGEGFEVVDWKTGNPRREDKIKTGGAYALLAEEALGVKVKRARVVYLSKKGEGHKEVILDDLSEWREEYLKILLHYHLNHGAIK